MKRLTACVLVAALTGCTHILSEKDVAGANGEFATIEPRLLGDWMLQDEKGGPAEMSDDPNVMGVFFRVERKAEGSKVLQVRGFKLMKNATGGAPNEVEDDKGKPIEFQFVKIDRFDLISVRSQTHQGRTEPILISWRDDGFALAQMNRNFFEENPKLIPHRKEENVIVLTADVKSLREFLKANGERESLWDKPENRLVFQRRKPPAAK